MRKVLLSFQYSTQLSQLMHRSSSTWAIKPEEASIGLPDLWELIAPQQHSQQLQMA